jgi:transcription termination factor Rho
MSVLDRTALEASPLADLHAVASELSIDGYRRLRRADLIGAILDKQSGAAGAADDEPAAEPKPRANRSRSRRRSSGPDKSEAARDETGPAEEADESGPAAEAKEAEEVGAKPDRGPSAQRDDATDGEAEGSRRRRGRRGGRARSNRTDEGSNGEARGSAEETDADGEDEVVEGVVELLAGGSGFVRISPPEPSDSDVYISSAQVKRCELVSGDRISGPKRAPRRSERFASLIRIETINGRPASEQADSARFDDLPAAYPSEQLKLGSGDDTLKAIDGMAPFGKGSRVSITGSARTGKTETLRRIAQVLHERDDLTVHLVLAGVRPEEVTEWTQGPLAPVAASTLAASEDTQNAAIDAAVDQAKRLAARGTDAVVLIDRLDACSRSVARRALGAARNLAEGGSVTVIATSGQPVGGETTVIALDAARAAIGKFTSLDPLASGVIRPDLLVGETGAKALGRARDKALKAEQKQPSA